MMKTERAQERREKVWIVSHGPDCLDGVTCAVVVSRYPLGAKPAVRFASNREVEEVLQSLPFPAEGERQHLWITDLSWSDSETDEHLQALAAAGTVVHWVDHHQSAIERWQRKKVEIAFSTRILSDRYAASRLVYEHLLARLPSGRGREEFTQLERLVNLADDNDRWIHAHPGSRELALTVATMEGAAAYEELLRVDRDVTYTEKMAAAWAKVEKLLADSRALAERTRKEKLVGEVRLVTASCAGYTSEIAGAWGSRSPNSVFALFDWKKEGVSFRRSPDCRVNLARLAEGLGGGGHAAAAGCEMEGLVAATASEVLQARVEVALRGMAQRGRDCHP